jgi:hypothetical protein
METQSQIKSMRLSQEVILHISKLAEEQNRSFSNMVETILRTKMKEVI